MVDDTIKEAIKEALRHGLEKRLSEKTAKSIVDAIDIDALLDALGEALEGEKGFQGVVNAGQFEELGEVLGALLVGEASRKVAKRIIGDAVPGGRIGVAIGNLVGRKAVKVLIEHIDWETVEEEVGNNLNEVKATNLKRLKYFAKTVGDAIPGVSVSKFWSKTDSEDEDDRTGLGAGGTIDG